MHVRLAHETDFEGFRRAARALLAQDTAPQEVHWSVASGAADLFAADAQAELPDPVAAQPAPRVTPDFLAMSRQLAMHRDPQRFALLYRLLWRLAREPGLRDDPLDPDMALARQMAQAVRRDIHKMQAFVRFRPVADTAGTDDPLHVAWFEPDHHIVEENAPWFRRRFAALRWAILTPERCVEWDRQQLRFSAGARRDAAPPADAGEALWLTYYRSIFNPARLNLPMLHKEMPRRYWQNLPEARLITPLAHAARERSGRMVAHAPAVPLRRIPGPRAPLAAAPGSLEELRAGTQACRACPIGARATQAVPGQGPLAPALMLVGEQPGDQEDLRGQPFVGPAGQLLDRALAAAGLQRDALYLTNAVRHFKFELRGKRRIHKTPSQQEAAACRHWLDAEIAQVGPAALVALGATAARALLGRPVAVGTERGSWFPRPDGRRVLVTLHPSALLRLPPAELRDAFEAFVKDLRSAAAPA